MGDEAHQLRERLPELAPLLDRLPAGPGAALGFGHAAERLCQAGEAVRVANAQGPPADRRAVVAALTAAVRAVVRCRAALVDELEVDDTLPRDMDQRLFGFFDRLRAERAALRAVAEAKVERRAAEKEGGAGGGEAEPAADDDSPSI